MKPRSTTIVVAGPQAEPCTVAEVCQQLGLPAPALDQPLDPALNAQLSNALLSARIDAENHMNRALMMQTQEMQLDHFPRGECAYSWTRDRWMIPLASPPLMGIVSLSYFDLAGEQQTIPCDLTFGRGPNLPAYTYQRSLGTDTLPGRISPGVFRWWPPTWNAEGVVRIRFRCGYNGPVTVSTTAGQAALASPFGFLADDVGRLIAIPGAGAQGGVLQTSVAAVDANGVATLADVPAVTAANVTASFGVPVPEPIRQAILVLAQDYYTNGYANGGIPDYVARKLSPYCNRFS